VNEREKKRHYNQRIVQVEHGSFTPVVFSAFGGCGRETHHFLSSLAEKLATKKNFNPSVTTNWLRRKIAFALLRAQILCLRGSRTLRKVSPPSTSDMELSESIILCYFYVNISFMTLKIYIYFKKKN
jgi:hypothetical protein